MLLRLLWLCKMFKCRVMKVDKISHHYALCLRLCCYCFPIPCNFNEDNTTKGFHTRRPESGLDVHANELSRRRPMRISVKRIHIDAVVRRFWTHSQIARAHFANFAKMLWSRWWSTQNPCKRVRFPRTIEHHNIHSVRTCVGKHIVRTYTYFYHM